MKIDNLYQLYFNQGGYLTYLSKTDHNLKYDVTLNGSGGGSWSYTYEYTVGSGNRLCHYVYISDFLNSRIVTVDPTITDCNSICRIPIQTILSTNENCNHLLFESNYNSGLSSVNFKYLIPLLNFKIVKDTSDTIIINSITITSNSKNVIGSEFSYEPKIKKLSYNTELGSSTYTCTTTDGEITEYPKDFYMTLPPNSFPENDLTFTVAFTRNGVEESLTINRDRNLVLKEWEMSVIKINIGELVCVSKIEYISSDGNVVVPKADSFNVPIAINKYEDGLGYIGFTNELTSIGDHAFYSCSILTSVTIPDSVTSIGDSAFHYCNKLTSMNIGNSVTTIGKNAFQGCAALTSINIPDSVASIDEQAFDGCEIKTVNISDLVEWCKITFNDYAANPLNCVSDLYINNVLVTELQIPNEITTLNYCAFTNCTSITSVDIPDNVTVLGDEVFYECKNLTNVTIGTGITSIGNLVFYQCTSLKDVYCKAVTPPTLGNDVFYTNHSNRKIYVPSTSVDAYKAASGWSTYADAIVGYDFENNTVVE